LMAEILVTGANGFVGRALCEALRARGHAVVELSHWDGDIADPKTLDVLGSVEHVFHLAARTFVPDSWQDPFGFQKTNVLGTANVLEYCHKRCARMTFVSAYLYGMPDQLPVSETATPKPNNPYALSKYLAEQVCSFYAGRYQTPVTVIRPFNVFGPGQKLHFLVPHIVSQVRNGQSIRVKDLTPRRDYVYVDDLVEALVSTLSASWGYELLNVGSGGSLGVGELISIVQLVAGTNLPVHQNGEIRRNEIPEVYADIAKARALLHWQPKTTFAQGIEQILKQELRP